MARFNYITEEKIESFYHKFIIDDNLSRTIFIHDIKNRLGHDIVYYSNTNNLTLEGECFTGLPENIIEQ